MWYTLDDRLESMKITDLLKIYNSNKNYIFFKIKGFNVGDMRITLTNNYDKYLKYIDNNWNGYDFIIENDAEVYYSIEYILCKKFLTSDLSNLSNYIINLLKEIYKNNNHKY